MKAIITQIESVVTPSGNRGHVVVPKAWIGKRSYSTLKKNRGKEMARFEFSLVEISILMLLHIAVVSIIMLIWLVSKYAQRRERVVSSP